MTPLRREFLHVGLIAMGVLSAGMGLKGFLLSSNFIDGGVTGISMLLSKVTGVSLSILLPVVNLPFIFVALREVGGAFPLRSVLGIAGLAAAVAFIPYPDVTHDLLLTAVFGGFFIGAGIGLAIRGQSVLDGTEIAALLMSKRVEFLRVGDVILAFNVVLFLVAVSVLGVTPALYSILTYLTAAKTLDFFRGYGGMTGAEQDILYCVVTRLEIGRVKAIVRELDPAAFVVFHPLTGAEGGMVRVRNH